MPDMILQAATLIVAAVNPFAGTTGLGATEYLNPALTISEEIQDRHLPTDTIVDPIFDSPDGWTITGYRRFADSAIWSGHYLAAEAYRYAVTKSPEAKANAERILHGITRLIHVSGKPGLLARFAWPVGDSTMSDNVKREEGDPIFTGTFDGANFYWLDNVSRDQYSGAMFGLGVAYELLDDPALKEEIRKDASAVVDFLSGNLWNVVHPDGHISTTFIGRNDQILSFLQVGKLVDPTRFGKMYDTQSVLWSGTVIAPIAFELIDTHKSYYKFNLDHINLFNLTRLEKDSGLRGKYLDAFMKLRDGLRDHPNAHFLAMEMGVTGNQAPADTIREYLSQWLERPRRDPWVQNSSRTDITIKDGRAAEPLRVDEQCTTDFLWQRSPYLLDCGGDGTVEGSGLDYILPYWMTRYDTEKSSTPTPPPGGGSEAGGCAHVPGAAGSSGDWIVFSMVVAVFFLLRHRSF